MRIQASVRRGGIVLAALLVVSGAVMGATTSVTILNTAPTVVSAALPSTTVLPTAGGNTTVAATLLVSDLNGCNDIRSVEAEVLTPAGGVHVSRSAATYVSCADGTTATYSYSFPMRFHDPPAAIDAGYKLSVLVTDRQGATGTNLASLLVFAYAELAALQLDLSTFDFGGAVAPASQSSTLPLGVQNVGNVRIDAQLAGTALAHASEDASIGIGNLRYSTSSDMANATATGATAATLASFDLGAGSASARSLYWRLTVPSGEDQWVPSGVYAGTVTVSAVKG